MATKLIKSIYRVTYLNPKLGPKAAGDYIIGLCANDTISFRKSRTRTTFTLPLSNVLSIAMLAEVKAKAREKRVAALEKRKARRGE